MYAPLPQSGKRLQCDESFFDRNTTVACSNYVYDRSEFSSTLATELDLICDNENKNHFLGTVIMMGFFTGSLLGGPISDKIGRKTAIIVAIVLEVPAMIAGGYVRDYWLYVILRYFTCTVVVFGWIGSHTFIVRNFI